MIKVKFYRKFIKEYNLLLKKFLSDLFLLILSKM